MEQNKIVNTIDAIDIQINYLKEIKKENTCKNLKKNIQNEIKYLRNKKYRLMFNKNSLIK